MNELPPGKVLIEIAKVELPIKEAVLYVFKKIFKPGNFNIGSTHLSVDHPSVILFADLEPMANWSHQCKYIIYNKAETKNLPGSFPPDAADLLFLYKGEEIPDWVLLTGEKYG